MDMHSRMHRHIRIHSTEKCVTKYFQSQPTHQSVQPNHVLWQTVNLAHLHTYLTIKSTLCNMLCQHCHVCECHSTQSQVPSGRPRMSRTGQGAVSCLVLLIQYDISVSYRRDVTNVQQQLTLWIWNTVRHAMGVVYGILQSWWWI